MHRLFLLILALIVHSSASGHPPYAIVVNELDQAFFSDLTQVWMVDSDGSVSVVVHHVHTHELWLDGDGNLVGEDVTNVGDNYRHRVWKRSPSGEISNVVEWTAGHPSDIGGVPVVRNHRGEPVLLRRADRTIVVAPGTEREKVINLQRQKGHIHELAVHPGGDVFVAIGSSVYRIVDSDTTPELYASIDIDRTIKFRFVHDRHALMGMFATKDDVYVSVYAGQYVVRIDSEKQVFVAARSPGLWSPAGVTVDRSGNLWVLEFSARNRARAVKIAADGSRSEFDAG